MEHDAMADGSKVLTCPPTDVSQVTAAWLCRRLGAANVWPHPVDDSTLSVSPCTGGALGDTAKVTLTSTSTGESFTSVIKFLPQEPMHRDVAVEMHAMEREVMFMSRIAPLIASEAVCARIPTLYDTDEDTYLLMECRLGSAATVWDGLRDEGEWFQAVEVLAGIHGTALTAPPPPDSLIAGVLASLEPLVDHTLVLRFFDPSVLVDVFGDNGDLAARVGAWMTRDRMECVLSGSAVPPSLHSVIHGDALANNWLVDRAASPPAVTCLDFQFTARGCIFEDVAVLAWFAVADDHEDEGTERAVVDAYRRCLMEAVGASGAETSPEFDATVMVDSPEGFWDLYRRHGRPLPLVWAVLSWEALSAGAPSPDDLVRLRRIVARLAEAVLGREGDSKEEKENENERLQIHEKRAES